MRKRDARFALGGAVALWPALPIAAQKSEPKSEVELPLSTYDALRAAAKEKKAEKKEAPWASARLLRGSLAVDLGARRATWEAEIAAVANGEQPPPVALVNGAATIGRSSVSPESSRRRNPCPHRRPRTSSSSVASSRERRASRTSS
jgi:hypothetical protein